MIDALFNQPGFLAANKALDAVVLRGQAIQNNLANLETPGYQRIDLAPDFESSLQKAIASGNPDEIAAVNPTLGVDPNAGPSSLDGNNVHLESEMMQMNENGVAHSLETQLISGMFQKMEMAITGKGA